MGHGKKSKEIANMKALWKQCKNVIIDFYYNTLFILMSPTEASVIFILLCIDFTSK